MPKTPQLGTPDRRTFAVQVGASIRRHREAQDILMYDLAIDAGVSDSLIGAIERGESMPSLWTATLIADALGITVHQILERVTHETPYPSGVDRRVPGVHHGMDDAGLRDNATAV